MIYTVDSNNVVWRFIEDETVILNIDKGFYYTLNEVSGVIWNMLASNKSEDNIISKIVNQYSVDKKTVRKDLKKIISYLKTENLIVPK